MSQIANEDPDRTSFAIFTHAKIGEEGKDPNLEFVFFTLSMFLLFFSDMYYHAVSVMTSTKVGLVQRLIEKWPIILGLVLVIIFVVAVIFAMYKTNSFGKLRIFKNKLEKEKVVVENKRQSAIIQQQRLSTVAE